MAEAMLLETRGLSKSYALRPARPWPLPGSAGRATLDAVAGVDLGLRAGTTLAVVGESGCGKSTLAKLVVGLLEPSAGEVRYEGRRVPALGRHARRSVQGGPQMIFQDHAASLDPRWRVHAIVGEALSAAGRGRSRRERRELVDALLRDLGLDPADGDRYPHQLSGGQRQRVSIARALAVAPRLIVADEPTSALDVVVQAQILNLMRDLQERRGLAYLLISHDLAVVGRMAGEVAVMYRGRIVEQGTADSVLARPAHPYTRGLLDAAPGLVRQGRPRRPMPGEPAGSAAPTAGCAFHPRCPHARDRCRGERPLLRPAGTSRAACHALEEGRLDV